MRTQIFISYRREGGLDAANFIYDALHESYEVFFDKKSLRSGRFDIKIEEAIESCTDFLLILSKNIFERYDEQGDWISRETALALEHDVNIIPVFLEDFKKPEDPKGPINILLNYQGINMQYNDGMIEKLKGMLNSNKKCLLEIECLEGRYVLSQSSIELLKEIYRNTVKNEEYKTQVVFSFPNAEEVAEQLVSPTLPDIERKGMVEMRKQLLIGKQQNHCESVAMAIELMISDRCHTELPAITNHLSNMPLGKEYYTDEDGKTRFYSVVCAWVAIIEELLKEFTTDAMNRLTYYSNKRKVYTRLDCIIDHISKGDRKEWSFRSFAKNEEVTKDVSYYYFMKHSPIELAPETILENILPDFYYEMALEIMYGKDQVLKKELLNQTSATKFLINYWYGLS